MENSENRSVNTVTSLIQTLSKYLKLLLEDTRLNAAEKLTHLLSTITICALVLVLLMVALFFISLGFSVILGDLVGKIWAFFIIAAVYIIIAVILYACRRSLIIDPVARFISRLIIEAPTQPIEQKDEQPTAVFKN